MNLPEGQEVGQDGLPISPQARLYESVYKPCRERGVRPRDMRREWKRRPGKIDFWGMVAVVMGLFMFPILIGSRLVVVSPSGKGYDLPWRLAISVMHKRGWLTADAGGLIWLGMDRAASDNKRSGRKISRWEAAKILVVGDGVRRSRRDRE